MTVLVVILMIREGQMFFCLHPRCCCEGEGWDGDRVSVDIKEDGEGSVEMNTLTPGGNQVLW